MHWTFGRPRRTIDRMGSVANTYHCLLSRSGVRSRARVVISRTLAYACVLGLSFAGCSDGDEILEPEPGALPALEYSIAPTYAQSGQFTEFPAAVGGHLYLSVDDAGGVTGAISGHWLDSTGYSYSLAGDLSPVVGQRAGNDIEFSAGSLDTWPRGRFAWETFSIQLHDDDDDGVPDRAQGTMDGRISVVAGDTISESEYTSALSAEPDTQPVEARFQPFGRFSDNVMPVDAVPVAFSEPVRDSAVQAGLRVLADGVPIAGSLVVDAEGGMVTEAVFWPSEFLPFGADISLGVDEIRDPSDNGASAVGDNRSVVADPGALGAGAPTFESTLDNWITANGMVTLTGDYEGISPTAGSQQLSMRENSRLVGYLDVDDNAGTRPLSFTLFTEIGEIFDDSTMTMSVFRAPEQRELVFDASDHMDQNAMCPDCAEYAYRLGPVSTMLDLTPYRGQRVFVVLEVRSLFFIGYERHLALIDDIAP